MSTLADLRRDYASRALDEHEADPNPMRQFSIWFDEALKSQLLDTNAMTLATVSGEGMPSARIVLLKAIGDEGRLRNAALVEAAKDRGDTLAVLDELSDVFPVSEISITVDGELPPGVTAKDLVIDLGSGDGRIPIAAARLFGARAIGADNHAARAGRR